MISFILYLALASTCAIGPSPDYRFAGKITSTT